MSLFEQKVNLRSSRVAQRVKALVLSLLWRRFDLWPGKFCMPWVWQKKIFFLNHAAFSPADRKSSEELYKMKDFMGRRISKKEVS